MTTEPVPVCGRPASRTCGHFLHTGEAGAKGSAHSVRRALHLGLGEGQEAGRGWIDGGFWEERRLQSSQLTAL